MKNKRSNWQKLIFGILISVVWFGALPVYPQTKQDGKGVGVKVVSELPSKEKRWALIVGIDEYRNDVSTLKGSVNDAKALKNVLVNNAGFPENQIILLTTDSIEQDNRPTRENILGALSDLYSRVPEEGLLLFSFSGHGISVGNQAFLIPSNGRFTKNPELLQDFSIDVSRIKRAIETMKVKQVLMLLDACRNEPGKGDTPNNLTNTLVKGFSFDVANSDVKAFATLYATSIGERAFEFYDKDTKQFRGYFSYAVEEALKGKAANEKGEVTLSRLIDYLETTVPKKVKYDKGETQIPMANYSETYRANQLILSVAGKSENNSLSASQIAWNNFFGIAKKVLRYDHINTVSEGLAVAHLNNKRGFINLSGDSIVPPNYEVYSFTEGLAAIKMNEKWGFINKTGKVVIKPTYVEASQFREGLARVKLNNKFGYIDRTGKVIIPIKYDYAGSSFEGLLGVGLNEKFGFIDRTDKVVIPFEYDDISAFSEGLAPVTVWENYEKPHCQYINKNRQAVINTFYVYNSCESFSEGLAAVGIIEGYDEKNEETIWKWGFIDTKGNKITENIYNKYSYFEDGVSGVVKNNKLGVIDKNGRTIIPFKYDDDGFETLGSLIRVSLNKKIGFFDYRGNEIIPTRYDSIWCYAFIKEGFIGVILKGKKGFVDIYGNEYFDF